MPLSNQVEKKLQELFDCWTCSNGKDVEWYILNVLPNLKANPDGSGATSKEKQILQAIRESASTNEWKDLELVAIDVLERLSLSDTLQSTLMRLEAYLKAYQFRLANELFYENAETLDDSLLDSFEEKYHSLRDRYESEFINEYEKDFRYYFMEEQDLKKMGSILIELEELGESSPLFLKRQAIRIRDMRLQYEVLAHLVVYEFQEADSLVKEHPHLILLADYERKKARFVKEYLGETAIDDDQALALSKVSKNLLVKARAGSGKTRTILYKTKLLLEKYDVKPSEILILAFNNDAASQIKQKLQNPNTFGFKEFENAMTFHGFAKRVAKPDEDILGGDDNEDIKRHEFLKYVLNQKVWNEHFQENLYQYFRREIEEIKRYGVDLNENEKLLHRRNLRQITLKGEHVKSDCEKFIADFLLEHDIAYGYEYRIRETIPDKYDLGRSLKPDFTLCLNKNDPGRIDGQGLIIEHWAIDESNPPPNQDKPLQKNGKAWSKSWRQYHTLIQRKRTFFQESGKNWLETSPADLECDGCHATKREHFETSLKKKLMGKGIKCEKLPEKEIISRIGERHKIRILTMFDKFITQTKKYEMTPKDIIDRLNALSPDEKNEIFIRLALEFLVEYEAEMKNRKLIDFDDCIIKARNIIKQENGKNSYEYYGNQFKIGDLKWIIIDEYQDFSNLFYTLIDTIRQVNPDIKLFCVGDDWQAINGFAGSSLDFFQGFQSKLAPAEITNVANNYRSGECIVSAGNQLMKAQGGEPAKHFNKFPEARIEAIDISKVFVDSQTEERFLVTEDHKHDFLQQKYLKACHDIVISNPEKDVLILSRTNSFFYPKLESFRNRLKECFLENEVKARIDKQVKIYSAHKAKGLEAEIVIIVKSCAGKFPLIHPDAVLDEIFGRTLKHVLDEERRLFYVELTRAKEKLFLLYEGEDYSQYLEELGLVTKNAQKKNQLFPFINSIPVSSMLR